jgi:16S rRNA processing protein RimM
MRGALLTVPEDEIVPLPGDTYYHFQLIDMQVFSDEGEALGAIAEILDTSANDVYVIRSEGGPDLLIPAIREVVLGVDVDAGRMTVHLPSGLR